MTLQERRDQLQREVNDKYSEYVKALGAMEEVIRLIKAADTAPKE